MRFALAINALFTAGLAHAHSPELLRAIEQAPQERVPMEILADGRPVHLVPAATRPCKIVGVIHQGERRHPSGPRIDNYQVCTGAAPLHIDDVSPALPDDPQFKAVTQIAMRAALRQAVVSRTWQDYRIDTVRETSPNAYGCALVATTISNNDLLVHCSSGRLCP